MIRCHHGRMHGPSKPAITRSGGERGLSLHLTTHTPTPSGHCRSHMGVHTWGVGQFVAQEDKAPLLPHLQRTAPYGGRRLELTTVCFHQTPGF